MWRAIEENFAMLSKDDLSGFYIRDESYLFGIAGLYATYFSEFEYFKGRDLNAPFL
jgi:hypothetical protein